MKTGCVKILKTNTGKHLGKILVTFPHDVKNGGFEITDAKNTFVKSLHNGYFFTTRTH